MSDETQHYFSATPAGDYRPREVEVDLAGSARTVVTAGGVFSPDGIDRGTEVLLRWLDGVEEPSGAGATPDRSASPEPDQASAILDIGCGWGPIAVSAALAHPDRQIWAIDVNARSRELCEQNAARLGAVNVHVVEPDAVPADLEFAEIRSNPPIRVGKEALHVILRQWLPRLADGGSASLVVAKHLGAESLAKWIAREFPTLAVERAHRDRGFHVLRVTRE